MVSELEDNELSVSKNGKTFTVVNDESFSEIAHWDFWNIYPDWENETFEVLDRFLDKDLDFLDIGAWVGPVTLYAATLSKNVYALEPDPVAFCYLSENVARNCSHNTLCINKAVSPWKNVFIDVNKNLGSSMSYVSGERTEYRVDGIGIDDLLGFGDFSLVKMDIEGYESILLEKYGNIMASSGFKFYISFHESFFDRFNFDINQVRKSLECFSNVTDHKGNEVDLGSVGGFSSYIIW